MPQLLEQDFRPTDHQETRPSPSSRERFRELKFNHSPEPTLFGSLGEELDSEKRNEVSVSAAPHFPLEMKRPSEGAPDAEASE